MIMKIGVVILNYNSAEYTVDCIASLLKCVNSDDFFIIVVDNKSTDNSVEYINNAYSDSDICFIQSGRNGGFSFGNNIGIRRAIDEQCDYIMLINEDTEVSPNFAIKLVEFMSINQDVAMCAPKICYYSDKNKIWSRGGRINWMLAGENGDLGKKDDQMNALVQATFLTGCCLFFRPKLIKDLGYLSEEYFMYYEDVDLSYRINRAGLKMYCVTDSVIYHKIGMASGGEQSAFTLEWCVRSQKVFLKKLIKENSQYYILYNIVLVRNFIRFLYFYIFKGKDKALAILNGIRY